MTDITIRNSDKSHQPTGIGFRTALQYGCNFTHHILSRNLNFNLNHLYRSIFFSCSSSYFTMTSTTRCAKMMSITRILCSVPSSNHMTKVARISKRSTSPNRSRRQLEIANLVKRFNTFLDNDYPAKSTKKDVVRVALGKCFEAFPGSAFSMSSLRNALPYLEQQFIDVETCSKKEEERKDDLTSALEKLQLSTLYIERYELAEQMTNLSI